MTMYPNNPVMGGIQFNPYYNPTPINPVIPNYQPVQATAPAKQLSRVNGKESVMATPMAPNSSEIMVDNLEPKIWVVTTDASGYKAVNGFWIIPDTESMPGSEKKEEKADLGDLKPTAVPVKDPIEQLLEQNKQLMARIEKLEERMNSNGKSDYRASRQDKSVYSNGKPNGWNDGSREGSDGGSPADSSK